MHDFVGLLANTPVCTPDGYFYKTLYCAKQHRGTLDDLTLFGRGFACDSRAKFAMSNHNVTYDLLERYCDQVYILTEQCFRQAMRHVPDTSVEECEETHRWLLAEKGNMNTPPHPTPEQWEELNSLWRGCATYRNPVQIEAQDLPQTDAWYYYDDNAMLNETERNNYANQHCYECSKFGKK